MLKTIIILSLLITISGCASLATPGDPAFAPVMPIKSNPMEQQTGSIYQEATAMTLYDDRRARRVGDILTIRLVEQMQASKSAHTQTTRDTKFSEDAPSVLGHSIPEGALDLKSNGSFNGRGQSDQSNKVSGTITVSVASVLSNGYLMVRGEKWIHLNQGKEYIQLTGIIRPDDIDASNAVDSTRVADAKITYSGTGQMAESNVMGWLGRFFMGAVGGLFPF